MRRRTPEGLQGPFNQNDPPFTVIPSKSSSTRGHASQPSSSLHYLAPLELEGTGTVLTDTRRFVPGVSLSLAPPPPGRVSYCKSLELKIFTSLQERVAERASPKGLGHHGRAMSGAA